MAKYRFKTEEEFKEEGLWDYGYNVPTKWNKEKEMNIFLGEDVPKEKEGWCEKSLYFSMDGWLFAPSNYTLKEEYVREFQPIEEKLMEVANGGGFWKRRVVFGKKFSNDDNWTYYYSWGEEDDADAYENVKNVEVWEYAREIKERKTKQQILEEYGLDLNKIEIID